MADIKVTKDLENKKLVLEWEVAAPREKVWKAYADKEMFEKWWGPEGWETTTKEFNFEPGGHVHYAMKCVDENQGEWFGQVSWGLMDLQEINAPQSFTYKDYFSDETGVANAEMPALTIVNEFIEENGKTRVVSTSQATSAEEIEQLIKMGMIEGFSSQVNRLNTLMSE